MLFCNRSYVQCRWNPSLGSRLSILLYVHQSYLSYMSDEASLANYSMLAASDGFIQCSIFPLDQGTDGSQNFV